VQSRAILTILSPHRFRWLTVVVNWLTAIAIVVSVGHLPCRAQSVVLVGVGSTVPLPLYAAWAERYNKRGPKFRMRYLPLGTSEGIRVVSGGSGDFGAGEVPLRATELSGRKLIEMPAALIGIAPIYNLPGVKADLRFTGEVLAEIFLGQVKTWNSPALARLNPEVALPDLPIKVIYRPRGKGSNYVFTDFLSRASRRFRSVVGISSSPNWPVGDRAERSADMVERVKKEPGSIGYVELQYAIEMQVPYGSVRNPSGEFVKPSNRTIAAACEAVESPGWDRFSASLIDASGPASYPISSFTWIYLATDMGNSEHAAAMKDLLNWMFSEGQNMAIEVGYLPLPPRLLRRVQAKISAL
jgi:phosphate transport system substrate-binding protein